MFVLPLSMPSIDCRSYLQNLKCIVQISTEGEGTFGTRHVCFNFEVVSGHFEVSAWKEDAINYFHPSNARDYGNILVVSKRLSLLVFSLV
jgi:hypothetical protein